MNGSVKQINSEELNQKPDICVLAYNSVLKDPRIMKEVESLSHAGYKIEIAGLLEKGAIPRRQEIFANVWVNYPSILKLQGRIGRLLPMKLAMLLALWLILLCLLRMPERDFIDVAKCLMVIGGLGLSGFLFKTQLLILGRKTVDLMKDVCFECLRMLPSVGERLESMIIERRWKSSAKMRLMALENFAAESGAAAIHCHDLWTLRAGVNAAQRSGATLVWDAHEVYDHLAQCSNARNAFHRRELNCHQEEVDVLITINNSIKDYYRQCFPKLPEAIVVKNALRKLAHGEYDGRLHNAVGVSKDQKIVIYQGGFSAKRGLSLLAQAGAYLEQDWTLVFLGWGPLEQELTKLASISNRSRPSGMAPCVVMLPKVPPSELAAWTRGATLGIIPYENCGLNHSYCTPNKLWEYPAVGVPILCSPLVELKRAVTAFGMGWFIPEIATPQTLAGSINSLTEKQFKEARIGCEAFMNAESWEVYEKVLLELYNGLIPETDKLSQ